MGRQNCCLPRSSVLSSSKSVAESFRMFLTAFGVDVVLLSKMFEFTLLLSAAISLSGFGLKFSTSGRMRIAGEDQTMGNSPFVVSLVSRSGWESATLMLLFRGDCCCELRRKSVRNAFNVILGRNYFLRRERQTISRENIFEFTLISLMTLRKYIFVSPRRIFLKNFSIFLKKFAKIHSNLRKFTKISADLTFPHVAD